MIDIGTWMDGYTMLDINLHNTVFLGLILQLRKRAYLR